VVVGPGPARALTVRLPRRTLFPTIMFVVRPADPADADVISELILLSDCGLLTALFGPRVRDLLRWLLPRTGNPYSRSNALVVTEDQAGAPPIGAMVGATAPSTRSANLRTAAQLARWYGPSLVARLPRMIRAGSAVSRLAPDDFYLSHIAVLPACQGRGAGGVLLRAAEEYAGRASARRLVLDVEEHNHGARAFYRRMGYVESSAVRINLGRHGVFRFLRLARAF